MFNTAVQECYIIRLDSASNGTQFSAFEKIQLARDAASKFFIIFIHYLKGPDRANVWLHAAPYSLGWQRVEYCILRRTLVMNDLVSFVYDSSVHTEFLFAPSVDEDKYFQ